MNLFKLKQNTHKYRLYEYLIKNKTITTRESSSKLGNQDLQGTIRDLKSVGVPIKTKEIKVPTRFFKADGTKKDAYIVEYRLGAVGGNLF